MYLSKSKKVSVWVEKTVTFNYLEWKLLVNSADFYNKNKHKTYQIIFSQWTISRKPCNEMQIEWALNSKKVINNACAD